MFETKARVRYLDGLRGIACLMVVAEHYSLSFQPAQIITPYDDGGLAVAIFFLMSGFVLTESFGQSRYRIADILAARAFRLLIPTSLAICAASCVYWLFQPMARMAALISGSEAFWYETQPPSLIQLPGDLLASLIGFSNAHSLPSALFIERYQSANDPIWTISYELYGSVLTLILTRIYRFRKPWWFLAITVSFAVFGFRELGLFVIGHITRVLWRQEHAAKFNVPALLVGGLTLYAFAVLHINPNSFRPVVDSATSGMIVHMSSLNGSNSIAGVVIFAVIIYSTRLQAMLQTKALLHLGRLSFSIYLIHWPIMLSFGSAFYLLTGGRTILAGWTTFVVGAMITGLVAREFERFIDAPAIAFSRKIRKGKSLIEIESSNVA